MSADDDRVRGRLDEDQERLLEAAAPHGFELRQPRKRPFEELALTAFEAADTVLTRLTGEIDGAKVDVFEYDWVTPGSRGAVSRGRRIVLVLRHPAFEGEVRCRWDDYQDPLAKALWWSMLAGLGILLSWLLVPIWLYQYSKGQNPFPKRWPVGNAVFEKRFKVHSSSGDEAKRALPGAMQELVVSETLMGPIEVRPGLLAIGLDGKSLDAPTLERALSLAKRVMRAYAPPPNETGMAYRVADDRELDADLEREEEATRAEER